MVSSILRNLLKISEKKDYILTTQMSNQKTNIKQARESH